MFFRPPHHGGKDRTGRPGSGEKEIGFEIPDFPKTRAHALRFGSMNPISSLLGGVVVEAMGAGGRES